MARCWLGLKAMNVADDRHEVSGLKAPWTEDDDEMVMTATLSAGDTAVRSPACRSGAVHRCGLPCRLRRQRMPLAMATSAACSVSGHQRADLLSSSA